MSIKRLLLRSLACNALSKHPYDVEHVTMAGVNVFDSRLDPIEFDKNKNEIPTILVYTDDDEGHLWNRADNSGPYQRHIELRIEIALGSFESETVTVDNVERQVMAYGLPGTDAMLEAKLDLFEQQVMWALRYLNRPATLAFMQYVVRIESIESHPYRDESGTNRLAIRRIHMRCCVNDDCLPPYKLDDEDPVVKKVFCGQDFEPLPPWLHDMLVSQQKSPSMKAVISALAGDKGNAQTFPLLKRVVANVDYIAPAFSPTLVAALGQKFGPDQRIEIKALWELSK